MKSIECNKDHSPIKPPNQNILPEDIRLTKEQQMALGYDRDTYYDLCHTYLDPHCFETRHLTKELIHAILDMHENKF